MGNAIDDDIVAHAATKFCEDRGVHVWAASVRSPEPCPECGCGCQVKGEPLRVDVQLPPSGLSVEAQIQIQDDLQEEFSQRWPHAYLVIVEMLAADE